MATIQTAIRLIDQVTSPMRNITQAVNMTISAFEALEASSFSSIDGMNFDAVREKVNAANIELNDVAENIRRNEEAQEDFNESMNKGAANGNKLLSSIKKMAAAYISVRAATEVLGLSDAMSLAESRLSLIVDDGGSVQELENKIYASAQRSRANYQDTINTVSKLGLLAGKAFSGNDEIIAFQELMNKNFIIGGASAQEQASAMYQLTQAMASGRLQGDEYRSIIENAPLLAKAIEDYMVNVQGVEGTMKDWASEGMLTADVIKAALFSSADEIESRFENMPMTFGQVWTSIKNQALVQFQPILKKLNEIANSEQFNRMAAGVTTALVVVSGIVTEIFELVAAVGGFIYDNWSMIAPVVGAVTTALGIYAGYLAVTNGLELISKGIKLASIVATYAHAAATGTAVAATTAQAAAQMGLNTALLACPITWIIIAIIALIALLYLVVAAVNKFAGTSVSATGIIFGAFATLGAFLWNLFLGLLELVFGIIEAMVNPFIKLANFIGNVFTNPISSIIYLFQGMADGVLAILEKIASALDFVFGSKMADSVAGWRSGLKDMADAAVAKYAPNENYQNVMDELDLSVESLGLKRWAYGDAWDAGYKAGENLEEAIGNFDPASLFQTNIPDADAYASSYDPSQYLSSIADDTDSIAGSVELSGEELKYIRDLAERDTVNRFTTAELHFNMGGVTNNVSSEVDLDGMVTYLEEKVGEALEIAAEGVHK
jgi:tape measure domain-containing protein